MIVFMIQGRDIEYKVSFSPCQGESPFAGINTGATALTSTGGKLCGHPQFWWSLGHSGNSYLYTQPQCCQPPCARLHCHSAWPLLHLETSPYPVPSFHSQPDCLDWRVAQQSRGRGGRVQPCPKAGGVLGHLLAAQLSLIM